MRASVKLLSAAAMVAAFLAGGCSSSGTTSQMKLGLWASRHLLWDEAIFRWRRAVQADPRSAAAHNNLAVAYEAKAMWEEARKEYEAALAIDPRNKLIQSNFSRFKENLEGRDERRKEPPSKDDHDP